MNPISKQVVGSVLRQMSEADTTGQPEPHNQHLSKILGQAADEVRAKGPLSLDERRELDAVIKSLDPGLDPNFDFQSKVMVAVLGAKNRDIHKQLATGIDKLMSNGLQAAKAEDVDKVVRQIDASRQIELAILDISGHELETQLDSLGPIVDSIEAAAEQRHKAPSKSQRL